MLPARSFLEAPSVGSFLSMLFASGDVLVEHDLAYGPDRRHRLDIYTPPESTASTPVAMFFYGGGWTSGHRAQYGFAGAALAAAGITTVVPDYRLYPDIRFPAFVEDAARAVAWTQTRFRERSPGRIALTGHSAGAYIAAMVAYRRSYLDKAGGSSERVSAFAGLAGPYAFDPTTWPSTQDIFATAPDADDARPVSHVEPGAVPALLLHGSEDSTVKPWNSRQLADRLRDVGSSVDLELIDGLGHVGIVTALARPLQWRAPVLDRLSQFILRTTGR